MSTQNPNNADYSLYSKILDYTVYVKTYITCAIPGNNRDIRIHLLDELYALTKNMFYATYTKGNVRNKHLIDIQVSISLIDMMTNELRKVKTISKKHLDVSVNKLASIKNMIYAWKFNEESKKN